MMHSTNVEHRARLILEAVADWDSPPFPLLAETLTAIAAAGADLGAITSPLVKVLSEFIFAQLHSPVAEVERTLLQFNTLDAQTRTILYEQLDALILPSCATTLADILNSERRLPFWNRLPRLLAAADPERLDRLSLDCATLEARRSLAWAECVTEGMLGAIDAAVSPSGLVAQEFGKLVETNTPHTIRIESYQAQLRLAARENAAGALDLLKEACWEVGYYQVERGLEAVVGRVTKTDRSALDRFLFEQTDTIDERALVFRASLWEATEPDDAARLQDLITLLEGAVSAGELGLRQYWSATHELLAAAARLGLSDDAARIIRITGPPKWTILNATWLSSRKRAIMNDSDPNIFIQEITPAFKFAGGGVASRDPAPEPAWTTLSTDRQIDYWRLRSVPLDGMPWWTPWGDALP